ncbi:unnamed protein product [Nippostrongylus brasiliensis]|uniref:CCHC-type domain-containing protein n=1 Tax=Nippostrongylus brasiliensis TaxID=27835 RepID=A0A158QX56_NIPBR|nr:unnamed protein product [Nippostrongylus brasiliensis]
MPRGRALGLTAAVPRTRRRAEKAASEAGGTPNPSSGCEVECDGRSESVDFQADYNSSASEKDWSPRPEEARSTHHYGRTKRKICEASRTSESEGGEIEESVVRPCAANRTDKGNSFQNFVESFELKYPVDSWEDSELCALFRAKLLERLTRQAYPELDENALATERAHLLYEQLVYWKDSYYLMEALESEGDAYLKLKTTAQRIERRGLTLRNIRTAPGVKSEPSQGAKPPVRSKPPDNPVSTGKEVAAKAKGGSAVKEPLCFTCKKPGHRARDCPRRSAMTRVAQESEKGSLSARLLAALCRSSMSRSGEESLEKQNRVVCSLCGRNSTVKLELFGRTWMGLLDTGSEISILPAEVLLRARSDGVDIDRDVKECPMEGTKPVLDASGARMQFVTVVEVPVTEVGRPKTRVEAKMHLSKRTGEVIIGTNLLPLLGYELSWQEPKQGFGVASDQGEVKRSSQQGDVHHTAEGTQLSEDAMNERMIKEAQKKIKHECDDSRESNRRGKKKAASSEHKGGMAASSKKGQKANKSQERIVKGSSNERRPASKKPKAVIKSDVPIPEVTNNSMYTNFEPTDAVARPAMTRI